MILKKETKTLKPVSSTRKLENASIENNETHKENVQERRIDPIGQDAVEKYPKTVKAEKRFQNIEATTDPTNHHQAEAISGTTIPEE